MWLTSIPVTTTATPTPSPRVRLHASCTPIRRSSFGARGAGGGDDPVLPKLRRRSSRAGTSGMGQWGRARTRNQAGSSTRIVSGRRSPTERIRRTSDASSTGPGRSSTCQRSSPTRSVVPRRSNGNAGSACPPLSRRNRSSSRNPVRRVPTGPEVPRGEVVALTRIRAPAARSASATRGPETPGGCPTQATSRAATVTRPRTPARSASNPLVLSGFRVPRFYSRKARRRRARLGWRSLRSAFASICRMRSRVTSKSCPTSSSV